MAYKSIYRVVNKEKYIGNNIAKVICRSTWENGVAKYCDHNPSVVKWAIESVVIPYYDTLFLKSRKYFIDFYIELQNGDKYLIEIKPHHQTTPPVNYKNRYKEIQQIISESVEPHKIANNPRLQGKYKSTVTYAKNYDKWFTADKYATKLGMKFKVWTEHTLRSMGIVVIPRRIGKTIARTSKPQSDRPARVAREPREQRKPREINDRKKG